MLCQCFGAGLCYYIRQTRLSVRMYLDLHALLQEPLGLVLHLQSGSADQQQIIFNHLDAAQIHTLGQIVWKGPNTHSRKCIRVISGFPKM